MDPTLLGVWESGIGQGRKPVQGEVIMVQSCGSPWGEE